MKFLEKYYRVKIVEALLEIGFDDEERKEPEEYKEPKTLLNFECMENKETGVSIIFDDVKIILKKQGKVVWVYYCEIKTFLERLDNFILYAE